jgi:hypothetical protein
MNMMKGLKGENFFLSKVTLQNLGHCFADCLKNNPVFVHTKYNYQSADIAGGKIKGVSISGERPVSMFNILINYYWYVLL